MRWVGLTLLLALLACDDGPSAPSDGEGVRLGKDFPVEFGEVVEVRGTPLRLAFVNVTEESRCPPMGFCVWAGNASVVLESQPMDADAYPFQLCTQQVICPKAVLLGVYEVELRDVEPPAPVSQLSDYVITLRVRRSRVRR